MSAGAPAPLRPGAGERLFFALWPGEEERRALSQAVAGQVEACRGRPVPAQNLHLTLAFLGSVPVPRLPQLHGIALGAARALPPAPLPLQPRFDRLGYWSEPRILCALAAPEPAPAGSVRALAEALRTATAAAGFSPDLRPFHAHVTVARKVMRPAQELSMPGLAWHCEYFALIASRGSLSGPVYSVVESYPLVKSDKARR